MSTNVRLLAKVCGLFVLFNGCGTRNTQPKESTQSLVGVPKDVATGEMEARGYSCVFKEDSRFYTYEMTDKGVMTAVPITDIDYLECECTQRKGLVNVTMTEALVIGEDGNVKEVLRRSKSTGL